MVSSSGSPKESLIARWVRLLVREIKEFETFVSDRERFPVSWVNRLLDEEDARFHLFDTDTLDRGFGGETTGYTPA